MRARQREICQVVIEIGRGPRRGVVTENTVGRESGGGMIGVCRGRVVLLMASDARGNRTRVPGRMATVAGYFNVRAGQRERRQVVIQLDWSPCHSCVAIKTPIRESGADMIRIGRVVEICLVAGEAIGGGSGVCCRMTTVARRARVAIGQWECRRMDVSGKLPGWRCLAMARLAIL